MRTRPLNNSPLSATTLTPIPVHIHRLPSPLAYTHTHIHTVVVRKPEKASSTSSTKVSKITEDVEVRVATAHRAPTPSDTTWNMDSTAKKVKKPEAEAWRQGGCKGECEYVCVLVYDPGQRRGFGVR